MAVNYFTEEGLAKLKEELLELKTKGRSDMAKQIAEAREKGDLSENAEYDAAKEAQGMLEMKIAVLENNLANSRIISIDDIDTNKVSVMSKVKILNMNTKKESEYQLVSEKEANVKENKISVTSPIGKGLLGKAKGEVAEIHVPAGTLKIKVLQISI